jgi:hypothetical protein
MEDVRVSDTALTLVITYNHFYLPKLLSMLCVSSVLSGVRVCVSLSNSYTGTNSKTRTNFGNTDRHYNLQGRKDMQALEKVF